MRPRAPRVCHHYHAPWSRCFKTHFMRGSYGWEVQIGAYYWLLKYGTRKPTKHHDPYWRGIGKARENSLLGRLRLGL